MSKQTVQEWIDGVISDDTFYAIKSAHDAEAWTDEPAENYDAEAYMEDTIWG